jgi:peroxin-3
LTLFTHLQLSLLNRIKYVQSVHQLDFEERERESYGLSSPSKLLPTPVRQWLTDDSIVGGYDTGSMPLLGPESEMKFLTMSWWLLHVGWKDVGERVRRAVEEVFDEYVTLHTIDACLERVLGSP